MPPNRSRSSRNSTEQEGRVLLAIQAIKTEEIRSTREENGDLMYPSPLYDVALLGKHIAQRPALTTIN